MDAIQVVDENPKISVKKLNGGQTYRILPPFKNPPKRMKTESRMKFVKITREDSAEYQNLMAENRTYSILNLAAAI